MKTDRKYILGALSLFLCGLFAGCENNVKDLPNYRQKQISVDEGKKITAFMSENAKVKAKLAAPYMRRREMDSPYVQFTNTLHVDFYNDSLVIESVMDCLYGKIEGTGRKSFSAGQCGGQEYSKRGHALLKELWWIRRQKSSIRISRYRSIRQGVRYCMAPGWKRHRISAGILFIR